MKRKDYISWDQYFVKRFYGVEDTCEIPQEEGKEWFHA